MKKNRNIDEVITKGIMEFFREYRKETGGGPWYKLGVDLSAKEISDEDRQHLLQNSRDRFWKTSEGHSIINSIKHYVIGKGITFHADDENPVVQKQLEAFWNDPLNNMELRQKEIVNRTLRDGEVFIRKFVNEITGMTIVRFVEPSQITKINKSVNDAEVIESYHREWVNKGETEQRQEDIPANQIIHIKIGVDSDMDRGLPYLYPVIRRLVQLDQFIDSRTKRNKLMAAVLLEKILKGKGASASAVSSISGTSTDATIYDSTVTDAAKKMPKDGAFVTHNEAIEYKWNTAQVNADDCKEDGRLLKLSICAGANIPEFLLGDASNANYSSTLVAESPFVRNCEDLQDTFEEYFKILFRDVIQNFINAGTLPADSKQTIVKERKWLAMILPEASNKTLRAIREVLVGKEVKETTNTKLTVKIEFPNLIHRDIKAESEALLIQQNMGIISRETIAGKLGINWEEEQDKVEADKDADMDRYAEQRDNELKQEKDNGTKTEK